MVENCKLILILKSFELKKRHNCNYKYEYRPMANIHLSLLVKMVLSQSPIYRLVSIGS